MGDSVWLFMWFLDKMTIIDSEKGEGKVLGGKPIKYEDVKDDLGISRSTYIRWLSVLRKWKYLKTLRTPYGQVITVLKAKKRFGRSSKNDTSEKPEMTHLSHENDTSNKTVSVDTALNTAAEAARQFNFQEYLKAMEDHKARHIQVIAFYWKKKKLVYKSLKEAQSAIRRHLRAAKEVANFEDETIVKAYKVADREYPNIYTVETLHKILTR